MKRPSSMRRRSIAGNRNYAKYIATDWKAYYFQIDELQAMCKGIRRKSGFPIKSQITEFDNHFHTEIKRVFTFVEDHIKCFELDLQSIEDGWNSLPPEEQDLVTSDKSGRTMERMVRILYADIVKLQEYYDFNKYLISKTVKKFERILTDTSSTRTSSMSTVFYSRTTEISRKSDSCHAAQSPLFTDDDAASTGDANGVVLDRVSKEWMHTPLSDRLASSSAFQSEYVAIGPCIERRLTSRCIKCYQLMFRQDHPNMAEGELRFIKSRDRGSKSDRILLGAKIGFFFCMFGILLFDSLVLNLYDFEFAIWSTYGMAVYATVGNFLLFKVTWALSVGIWGGHGINYISIFDLNNLQTNTIKMLNETCTLLCLWVLSLYVFFQANSVNSPWYNHTLNYMCPVSLIVCSVLFCAYKWFYLPYTLGSRGLFTWEVVKRCLSAPFVPIQFRDTFAGDVLTSFNRVIQDSTFSAVWLFSGDFVYVRNGDSIVGGMGQKSIEAVSGSLIFFVLWIRLAQCLRSWRDTGLVFPHLYNGFKYVSAMAVVLYGLFRPIDGIYIFLICWATIFKWWWDVSMDWGLDAFIVPHWLRGRQTLPHYTSLRGSGIHLYKPLYMYYVAIVVNLILRFVWVTSLVPPSTLDAVFGPLSGVYFGSLEIIRRFIWGLFRLEWEHLKFAEKKVFGYRISTMHSINSVQLSTYKAEDDANGAVTLNTI